MNIVLIVPSNISGGVATVFHNLYKGLVIEGVDVDIIKLGKRRSRLLSTIYYDILNAKHLTEYDLVLYIGSIPWPSHILAKLSNVPVALFLHGFIYHELFHKMLHEAQVRNKIGSAFLVTMFKTATSFNTIDLYVSPSLTVCEDNKISDRFVLLPQWVFPEELEILKIHQVLKKSSMIRIVAYTSYADSPRLLNMSHLIALAQIMKHMVNRDFELIIVDPRKRISSFGPIKIVGPMPRQEFLSLLASADLYIERGIDEDLGQVVLEAMAMGTPIAKLTHPKYWDRQDYKEDLMLARSFKELTNKIAEYINNIEYYYDYYSKICRKFVLTKRTWDAVKEPFLTALKHISQ
jgi:glycosyltransferase involved in cell wall biosynthesis